MHLSVNRIFQQLLSNSHFWGNSGFKEQSRRCKLPDWPVTAQLHSVSVASPLQTLVDELQWWQVWLCFCRISSTVLPQAWTCCSWIEYLLSPRPSPAAAAAFIFYLITAWCHLSTSPHTATGTRTSPQKTGNICPSSCVYNSTDTFLWNWRSPKILLSKLGCNNF